MIVTNKVTRVLFAALWLFAGIPTAMSRKLSTKSEEKLQV